MDTKQLILETLLQTNLLTSTAIRNPVCGVDEDEMRQANNEASRQTEGSADGRQT